VEHQLELALHATLALVRCLDNAVLARLFALNAILRLNVWYVIVVSKSLALDA